MVAELVHNTCRPRRCRRPRVELAEDAAATKVSLLTMISTNSYGGTAAEIAKRGVQGRINARCEDVVARNGELHGGCRGGTVRRESGTGTAMPDVESQRLLERRPRTGDGQQPRGGLELSICAVL